MFFENPPLYAVFLGKQQLTDPLVYEDAAYICKGMNDDEGEEVFTVKEAHKKIH